MLAIVASALGSVGCGDGGTQPGALRYGQLGHMRVVLDAPIGLRLGAGHLRQTLEWESTGAWTLREAIAYLGVTGDEELRRSPGDPAQFALPYATLITQLNEEGGLQLFIADLPSDLEPECGATRTRITLTIHDDVKNEETTWIRCAEGSLANLTPAQAGPDPAASRVAQAAILARDFTVTDKFTSAFAGSVPFATLHRGDDLAAGRRTSAVFTDSAAFRSFWGEAGSGRPLPKVDFAADMVVLGVVGEREEAGDSVEVRRILQVDQGTLIEVWERRPGDYCSPAARRHVPYHVVVAPSTPAPLRFSDVRVELVPCGG